MIFEKIDLYKYFGIKRQKGAQGYLRVFLHDKAEGAPDRIRPAMVVITGGGYRFTSQREEEPIALKYFAEGFNAFALDYSVYPLYFPTQLIEGAMAMCYARENAEKFAIDKEKVCAIGFSAGGHLCASLATMFDREELRLALGEERFNLIKPNAVVLSYPVITYNHPTHQRTFTALTDDNEQLKKEMSIETKVTKDTSPAFIWSTFEDASVPCQSSICMAMALKYAGVPFELHIYEKGCHGLSLANRETSIKDRDDHQVPATAKWFSASLTWLENRGFVIRN